LDEATSALDHETEEAVIKAVDVLRGQRTIVLIAHRLTTLRGCDQVFVLRHGRIWPAPPGANLGNRKSPGDVELGRGAQAMPSGRA
jgi:ABC-type bacteriocin/lantibiotic exporter with double-glycine peptidase domain